MPIEGERRAGPELIPIIRDGQRDTVTKRRLISYDLDTAQALVDSAGRTLVPTGDLDPSVHRDLIDHLKEFVRAAEEVIAASRREVDHIQAKRSQLRGDQARSKYDEALNRLRITIDRHCRMKDRLQAMCARAINLGRSQRNNRPDTSTQLPTR